MIIKRAVFTLAIIFGVVAPVFTYGAVSAALFSGSKDEACKAVGVSSSRNKCDEDKLTEASEKSGKTIERIINLLSVIIGFIAVIMIIIAGFRFVTSGGDSGNVTNARNTAIYAIVGLILVAFAQIIVKFILQRI